MIFFSTRWQKTTVHKVLKINKMEQFSTINKSLCNATKHYNHSSLTIYMYYYTCIYNTFWLTLHFNWCCLWCIATQITGFTHVLSSLSSADICEHQLTSTSTHIIPNLDPRHHWIPRYITKQSQISSLRYVHILYWLYGWRYCKKTQQIACKHSQQGICQDEVAFIQSHLHNNANS